LALIDGQSFLPGARGSTGVRKAAMPARERPLPGQPSLRYLKLAAKRRLAAGEFATLHDARLAVAREHGQPSCAALRQFVAAPVAAGNPALAQLRWVTARFSGAGSPGWAPPGENERRESGRVRAVRGELLRDGREGPVRLHLIHARVLRPWADAARRGRGSRGHQVAATSSMSWQANK
jgi:hypothetical protein